MSFSRVRTSPTAQVDALADAVHRARPSMAAARSSRRSTGACAASAYRIKKNRKAHYVLLNIDAPSAAVAELERQMSINEDVIRYLTVRVDDHEEGPSAMMRRSAREDRDRPRWRSRRPWGDRPPRRERPRFGDEGVPAAAIMSGRRRHERPRRPFSAAARSCPFSGTNAPKIDYKDVTPAAALRLGARQDRAQPHHRRLRPRSSASSPRRSSAPASWRSCPTS